MVFLSDPFQTVILKKLFHFFYLLGKFVLLKQKSIVFIKKITLFHRFKWCISYLQFFNFRRLLSNFLSKGRIELLNLCKSGSHWSHKILIKTTWNLFTCWSKLRSFNWNRWLKYSLCTWGFLFLHQRSLVLSRRIHIS